MIEAHGRELVDSRTMHAALALVLAAAFVYRFAYLSSGIPYAVGIDEPAIMTTVVRILKSGSFNPHFFEYPTGYIYVQLGVAVVNFLYGAMQHTWKAVEQVGPSDFYLWGRAATAAIGTATVALLHRAAARWGGRAALLAAGLLAVMPMHVRESHFVLTDVPMTFAVVLTFLLSLRASEKPALTAFVLAGAAAGLAAGIKYNGLMAFSMPLVAALTASPGWGRRTAAALAAAAACVAAFFLTTPYALLDLPAFLNGFGVQSGQFAGRPLSAEASWLVYVKHLRLAFGWPASAFAVAGLGIAAFRSWAGPSRVRWLLLVVFPAVYFYLITGWGSLFARYALPMVPFLALWAAIATMWAVGFLDRRGISGALRRGITAGVVVAVIVPGAFASWNWVRGQGTETTQALAWKWIKRGIWPGSSVVSEARGLELPAEIYHTEWVQTLADRDPAALAAAGVEWVVLSSDAWGERTASDRARLSPPPAYAKLLAAATDTKVIAPAPEHPGPEIHILILRHQ